MKGGSPVPREPTAADAARIVEAVVGRRVADIGRFSTGMAHFVYDVTLAGRGGRLVARLTRSETAGSFAGAVHWYPLLQEKGVPLPELIYAELDPAKHGFPVMLMARLPGEDLGSVYATLTRAQRLRLAEAIGTFQCAMQTLPHGPGYGYAISSEAAGLHGHWQDVVLAHLSRSRGRITDEAIAGEALIARTHAVVQRHAAYWDSVQPIAFLDDTTTKNVIVHRGRLSGVVDADFVCFGDVAQLVGLVRMALLSMRAEPDYAGFLAGALALNEAQRMMVDVCTLLYGLDFLTAVGHRFNKERPPAVEATQIRHMQSIVSELRDRV